MIIYFVNIAVRHCMSSNEEMFKKKTWLCTSACLRETEQEFAWYIVHT